MSPITEDDIANYLLNTPDFFSRHAETLAAVELISPHGGRAISLQERQALMLRGKIKHSESKIMDMIRNAHDYRGLEIKLQRFLCSALSAKQAIDVPLTVTQSLREAFDLPYAVLRLWGLPEGLQMSARLDGADRHTLLFTQTVGAKLKNHVEGLNMVFCGKSLRDVELQVAACDLIKAELGTLLGAVEKMSSLDASMLELPVTDLESLALLPIRAAVKPTEKVVRGNSPATIGLLLLGSNNAERFVEGMGLEFLQNLNDLVNAAVSRLYVD
jgi:uncharacterized protein